MPFKPASIVEHNAAREVVVETKTSGHTWLDDDEEDGESKVEEGAEDLVDLFGEPDTSEDDQPAPAVGLRPHGQTWEHITGVFEDAATTVQHRCPRIRFDADGLGLEDRTALDYVMWSFPINFIPAILNGTNRQLQGRQAELTRAVLEVHWLPSDDVCL